MKQKKQINKEINTMKKAEILTSMFLIGSFTFIGWFYWLTIKIGLWTELWTPDPYLVIFIVSIPIIGIVVNLIDEKKTYKRLNK